MRSQNFNLRKKFVIGGHYLITDLNEYDYDCRVLFEDMNKIVIEILNHDLTESVSGGTKNSKNPLSMPQIEVARFRQVR